MQKKGIWIFPLGPSKIPDIFTTLSKRLATTIFASTALVFNLGASVLLDNETYIHLIYALLKGGYSQTVWV